MNAEGGRWNATLLEERGDVRVYRLEYPGFWNCQSWCVATVRDQSAIILTNPSAGVSSGTSVTNIWSKSFAADLRAMFRLPEDCALYEHYRDAVAFPETLDRVSIGENGQVSWRFVADTEEVAGAFERILGSPLPEVVAETAETERIRQEDDRLSL